MRLNDFDFELPPDRIALRPVHPRDAARLLVVDSAGEMADQRVSDLPGLLRAGDALVLNDTRVIAARLSGERERDGVKASISVTLVRALGSGRWRAFARPARRLRAGDHIAFSRDGSGPSLLAAVAAICGAGEVELVFDRGGAEFEAALSHTGVMPLPPYIAARRHEDEQDLIDYQTIYAREPGSVAAPTAGLHFTPGLLERLRAAGVTTHFVTLEVGAGTFLPVKVDEVADHRMHAERARLDAPTAERLNAVRASGGRIVCVGTTSLRLLESAADAGGRLAPFEGETDIFITPGYRFRVAEGLMTNFHLPRSTLFMLVSALCGLPRMRRVYAHAIAAGYRFYSYGDASLLWRAA
jgi:S-adenosylmethionine:tRNA ribosyltransferase-isomerase